MISRFIALKMDCFSFLLRFTAGLSNLIWTFPPFFLVCFPPGLAKLTHYLRMLSSFAHPFILLRAFKVLRSCYPTSTGFFQLAMADLEMQFIIIFANAFVTEYRVQV